MELHLARDVARRRAALDAVQRLGSGRSLEGSAACVDADVDSVVAEPHHPRPRLRVRAGWGRAAEAEL